MTGQAIAYPAAKLDCGVMPLRRASAGLIKERQGGVWQSRRTRQAVKTLVVIEDCAKRLSSESAVDSVHVHNSHGQKDQFGPTPGGMRFSSAPVSRQWSRSHGARCLHLISSLIAVVRDCPASTQRPIEKKSKQSSSPAHEGFGQRTRAARNIEWSLVLRGPVFR